MSSVTANYFHNYHLPSRTGTARASDDRVVDFPVPFTPAAGSLQSKLATDLAQIADECSETGWDGYQALPIDAATCERVENFLKDLPSRMQAPDIVPEPDGEIAIEWYHGGGKALSISVGKDGPLHYAALFGKNQELRGVETFIDSVPSRLVRLISEFVRAGAD